MMAAFRAFAKSPVAAVLMGILIVAFAVWGVGDIFKVHISDAVVKAGSREINSADFKQRFDEQLQRYEQQTGQTISADDAVQQGVLQQALEGMATEESVLEAIRRSGVQASDRLVLNEIRKVPAFFNPVTGAFDEQAYERILGQHNMTPVGFQQEERDELSITHMSSAFAAGLKVPWTYAVLFAGLDQQTRAADVFMLAPPTAPPATPTDAQLNAFIKSHADQLREPETRMISLVRISAKAIEPTLTPNPADEQKLFDSEKAKLTTPERRSFVKIQAKDPAQAAAIAARLSKGENPNAVAASYGTKPFTYDNEPLQVIDDQPVAQAVFAMKVGQVSGPIQGQFGLAVAKLTGITPGKPATFDEVKAQIDQQLNEKAAKDAAYDQSEKYADAHDKGQNMDAAAKTAGLKVFTIPVPIDATGKMANGQPLPSVNDKMIKDAFSQPQGGETDITDLGNGEYYALRVDKVTPAHVLTLDEIRPQITRMYEVNQVEIALKAKADALVQRLKKGEAIDAVAASAGAKVQHLQLTRANAQAQQQALGSQLLEGLFSAKAGDVFDAAAQNYGFAVVKVDSIQVGSPADIAKESQGIRQQLSEGMARDEFTEMFYGAARSEVKPKIDLSLAYQALGVQPPASSAPAKAAGKAK